MTSRVIKWSIGTLLVIGVCVGIFLRESTSRSKTVGIQPFETIPQEYLDSVKQSISTLYGFNVVVLPSQPLPKDCFINVKSPRYRADKLLQYLKKSKPDSVDLMLGITTKDISTTKKDQFGRVKEPKTKYEDWGIFGLGYRPGNAAIVSTYRLEKPGFTLSRLRKVAIHEIGHNLGLKHCTQKQHCVMDDAAESIKTIDAAGRFLCELCKGEI